jgi:hypothetical protein
MPDSLDDLIAKARKAVARNSALVGLCQRRIENFKRRHAKAKRQRNRARKARKPKKAAFFEARMARTARKIRHWTQREVDAIEIKRSKKAWLARLLGKKAAAQSAGAKLVSKAKEYLGTNEGSALQRKWASNLGYSAALPWCSIFVANMLLEAGICTKSELPRNPAYSGSWIGWPGGRRVNLSERRPGDLLVFDWGDGGLSDHVAIYEGGNRHVGGNQSDQVNERPTPLANVVAVIRPL